MPLNDVRTGYIIFRDTALADAVVEFNRYSARKIVIEDPAFPEKRQPPACPRCRGSGRVTEGRSIVADVWEGFKSTNGPK